MIIDWNRYKYFVKSNSIKLGKYIEIVKNSSRKKIEKKILKILQYFKNFSQIDSSETIF